MVKFIESELVLLKKEIDEMWTLVYNQLDRAGEAVLTLDKELAQQVMVRERRVNAFELKIDSDVEDIIALYNPVAIDLRFVLAMLKINTNLERLGDFAEGIARFVIRSKEPVLDAELLNRLRLAEMQAEVLSMLELAKRALNEESIELAAGVFAKDNLLDEINAGATGIIADYITEHPEAVHTGVDLVSVFRKLERAGDHITNIAEEIVFFIDAKVLKHRGKRTKIIRRSNLGRIFKQKLGLLKKYLIFDSCNGLVTGVFASNDNKSKDFSKRCYMTCFIIWIVSVKAPIFAPLS